MKLLENFQSQLKINKFLKQKKTDELIAFLSHEKMDIRLQALDALGNLSTVSVISALTLAFKNNGIKSDILQALAKIGFNSDDANIRRKSIEMLRGIIDKMVDPIRWAKDNEAAKHLLNDYNKNLIKKEILIESFSNLLRDDDEMVRYNAVDVIAFLGTYDSLELLFKIINEDKSNWIKERAIWMLHILNKNFHIDKAKELIIQIFKDEKLQKEVRGYAAQYLDDLGALLDYAEKGFPQALYALSKLDDKQIKDLLTPKIIEHIISEMQLNGEPKNRPLSQLLVKINDPRSILIIENKLLLEDYFPIREEIDCPAEHYFVNFLVKSKKLIDDSLVNDHNALLEIICDDKEHDKLYFAKVNLALEYLEKAGIDALEPIIRKIENNPSCNYAKEIISLLMEIDKEGKSASLLKKILVGGDFSSYITFTSNIERFLERFGYNKGEVIRALKKSIHAILDDPSISDGYDKIVALLADPEHISALNLPSYGKVVMCKCGYPTELMYADHSVGAIISLVYRNKTGLYNGTYECPKCSRIIQKWAL